MFTKLLSVSVIFSLAMPLESRAEGFDCAGFGDISVSSGGAAKIVSSMREPNTRGQQHALVLLAKFKGEAPDITTAPDYAEALFDPNLPGSLSHFFSTMSSGQMELTATVLPKRYSSHRRADVYVSKVAGEPGKFSQFAIEVLRNADADVNFADFGNDGPDGVPNSGDDDGFADYVFINVLSAPHGFIQNRATGVPGLRFEETFQSNDTATNGGTIKVGPLMRGGSLNREGSFSQTVGTMAHEFGHALALPDLYDIKYEGPREDSAGIGKWGLMGWGAHGWEGNDGPNPLTAWSLKHLGWIGDSNSRLKRLTGDVENLQVTDFFSGGAIYQIALSAPLDTIMYNADPDMREQLIIENRS